MQDHAGFRRIPHGRVGLRGVGRGDGTLCGVLQMMLGFEGSSLVVRGYAAWGAAAAGYARFWMITHGCAGFCGVGLGDGRSCGIIQGFGESPADVQLCGVGRGSGRLSWIMLGFRVSSPVVLVYAKLGGVMVCCAGSCRVLGHHPGFMQRPARLWQVMRSHAGFRANHV